METLERHLGANLLRRCENNDVFNGFKNLGKSLLKPDVNGKLTFFSLTRKSEIGRCFDLEKHHDDVTYTHLT